MLIIELKNSNFYNFCLINFVILTNYKCKIATYITKLNKSNLMYDGCL